MIGKSYKNIIPKGATHCVLFNDSLVFYKKENEKWLHDSKRVWNPHNQEPETRGGTLLEIDNFIVDYCC